MPAQKKDPSVRARRNKSSSTAKLSRPNLRSVEDFADLTVPELRAAIVEANEQRPADQKIPTRGTKAQLLERLTAAKSPVPTLPTHPPVRSTDGELYDVEWHRQTEAWWNDVWTSPMATEWDESDVHNVLVVALLYDDIWAADSPKARKEALAEYRLQRADLGLSPYSRRRLEWTIETADEAKSRGDERRSKPAAQPKKRTTVAADPRSVLAAVK